VPASTERRGEILIESRKENTRVIKILYLLTFNGENLFFLTYLQKVSPRGLYRHLG